MENYDERINQDLLNYLENIRPTPERDPVAVSKGEARFMSELDELLIGSHNTGMQPIFVKLRNDFINLRDRLFMYNLAQRMAIAAILVFVVIVFSGVGIGKAAQAALPGDALYPVKIGLEQAEISISNREARQVELYLEFAENRLQEIRAMAEVGSYTEISKLVSDMETYLQKADSAAIALSASDPTQSDVLVARVADATAQLSKELEEVLAGLPDSILVEIQSSSSLLESPAEQQSSVDEETPETSTTDDGIDENLEAGNADDTVNENSDDSNTNDDVNDDSDDSNTNDDGNDNDEDDDSDGDNSNDNDDDDSDDSNNDDGDSWDDNNTNDNDDESDGDNNNNDDESDDRNHNDSDDESTSRNSSDHDETDDYNTSGGEFSEVDNINNESLGQ